MDTLNAFMAQVAKCKEIFLRKAEGYGGSWLLLRDSSILDIINVKAKRIRHIEESKTKLVSDDICIDYIGIFNYAIMILMRAWYKDNLPEVDLSTSHVLSFYPTREQWSELYDLVVKTIVDKILIPKNTDYGEAWRSMSIKSFTDQIIVRVHRLKIITENDELAEEDRINIAGEDPIMNYADIANYAVFALIRLEESQGKVNK